ncbi:carbohydrate-binding family 9-like protein [bacterium]|nr:carbohydrate-binding family 9-like protein [bacterium]
MKKYAVLLLICLLTVALVGERKFPIPMIDADPLSYVCYKTNETLTIDGKLDEDSWNKAKWTEDFVDIQGSLMPLPPFVTKAKMLWSDDYFYIGAYLEESDLWATITQRDAVIFYDNDFEVFIDPDGDSHDYYELEINALNTVWDLLVIKPYRDRGQVAFNSWDIKGLQTAVHLQGSLNDPSDKDEYWSVELAIPWESLAEAAHKTTPPIDKDIWKVNFSRVHWHLDKTKDGYSKKIDPDTKRHLPEMNIVWSPQGLIAMHYPEMWGNVMFSHEEVGKKVVEYIPDPLQDHKKYLRNIYYQQKEYFLQNGYYAPDLKTLDAKTHSFPNYEDKLQIYTSPNTFHLILKGKNNNTDLHIFQDGRLLEKIDFH